jgi:hypothetical protein
MKKIVKITFSLVLMAAFALIWSNTGAYADYIVDIALG